MRGTTLETCDSGVQMLKVSRHYTFSFILKSRLQQSLLCIEIYGA